MRTWIKVLVGLIIIGVIGGIAAYFFVYNKPHRNIEKAKSDISISASDLFASYKDNDTIANSKFLGKVIEVTGTLTRIETPEEDLTIAVMVIDEDFYEGIRVTMLPKHANALLSYKPGQTITLKGFCTGFISDVILQQGSIID